MTYPVFANGDVLNASDMNGVGLWLVKSQAVGSGVSSVTVTSCFNADYDNFLVTFNNIASTGGNGGTLNFQMVSSSTPSTTGYFGNTFFIVSGGGGGLSNAPFNNAANGEACSITTASTNNGALNLQGCFLASYTRYQHNSTDNNYYRMHSGAHCVATSYDGIRIIPSAGTITGGTIRVYGYRN